jgi:hypothetical protein
MTHLPTCLGRLTKPPVGLGAFGTIFIGNRRSVLRVGLPDRVVEAKVVRKNMAPSWSGHHDLSRLTANVKGISADN